MPDAPTDIARFALGIRVVTRSDGSIGYALQSANQGVPAEIVIMQLKAFLNNLEKEYFDNFNRNTSKINKS